MTDKIDLRKRIMMTRNSYSKMFRLYFADFSPGYPVKFRLCSDSSGLYVPVVIVKPKITTPQHIENWIIRTIMRSEFKDYLVKDHRYEVDFSKFTHSFYVDLFHFLLNKENANTSWLSPLQDMILKHKKAGVEAKSIFNKKKPALAFVGHPIEFYDHEEPDEPKQEMPKEKNPQQVLHDLMQNAMNAHFNELGWGGQPEAANGPQVDQAQPMIAGIDPIDF